MIKDLVIGVRETGMLAGKSAVRGDHVEVPVFHNCMNLGVYVQKAVEVRLGEYLGVRYAAPSRGMTILYCVSPAGAVVLLPDRDIVPYLEVAFEHHSGPPLETF